MTSATTENRWQAFWNRGGWWRAVLVAAVYAALYVGAGFLIQLLFSDRIDYENLLATPESLFFALGAGVVVGAILLAVFITTLKWWKPLFARQPIRGSWWMWIGVAIVLIPAIIRIFGIDYGRYSAGTVIVAFVFVGLFVGIAEELLTRGLAVKLLRDRGYSERVVAVLAATIFALLHTVNVLSQGLSITVALTVVYTFGFGIVMYVVMRATGNLIWAILLHGITDPTVFLATGGIDSASGGTTNGLLVIAGLENYLVIVFGLVAIFFIRGRVGTRDTVEASTGEA